MPQITKGGKFIFGKSLIRQDGTVQIPSQAVEEYNITADTKIYLFTGSKKTGGFCITRKGLLLPSTLGHILTDNPNPQNYASGCGEFIKYKGRFYCWLDISKSGTIHLKKEMMDFLDIKPGMYLLIIIYSFFITKSIINNFVYCHTLKHLSKLIILFLFFY